MENDWKSFSDPDLKECPENGMDIEIQMPDGHTFRAFYAGGLIGASGFPNSLKAIPDDFTPLSAKWRHVEELSL